MKKIGILFTIINLFLVDVSAGTHDQHIRLLMDHYDGIRPLPDDSVLMLSEYMITHSVSDYHKSLAHYQKGVLHRKVNEFIKSYGEYKAACDYLSIADTLDNYLEYTIRLNQ